MASKGEPDMKADVAPIDILRAKIFVRQGTATLNSHLENHYNIEICATDQLDVGVYRIDIKDGPSWIVRLFPSDRTVTDVKAEAKILQHLEQLKFPAECCAHPQPVSEHAGQPVLVTEFIKGEKPKGGKKAFYRLGRLLGRLHVIPISNLELRDGGAWHHIALSGGPKEEIYAAKRLLLAFESTIPIDQTQDMEKLHVAIDETDDLQDLPLALLHPDFVLSNTVVPPEGGFRVIDWSGAGSGPRILPLGWALWTAGQSDLERFDMVLVGYLEHVRLEPKELSRLASAMMLRPLILGVWEVCTARKHLGDLVKSLGEMKGSAERFASRAEEIVKRYAETT